MDSLSLTFMAEKEMVFIRSLKHIKAGAAQMLSGREFQNLQAKNFERGFRPYEVEAALYNEILSVPLSHLRMHEVSLP